MLYIIRHGQTQLNKAQVLQGRSDHPLNEEGLKQAAEAGAWFREQGIVIDHVYSSPLIRAVQTARLAVGTEPAGQTEYSDPVFSDIHSEPSEKQIGITIDDRLIEMDYGPYEGSDLTSPAPEILAFFQDFANHPAPDGMEQLSSVVGRLGELLEEIREEAERSNVLLSTHAIAMKGALEYLTPDSKGSYWSQYIGNCAVYQADVSNGTYGIPVEIR